MANDHISTTTHDNDEDNAIELESQMETESDFDDDVDVNSDGDGDGDVDANTESGYEKGNFFNRRKCQMADDWGPIGLNCTDEDIVTERVEVVGFLANWLNTYLYIRSEFPRPPCPLRFAYLFFSRRCTVGINGQQLNTNLTQFCFCLKISKGFQITQFETNT